LEQLTLQGQVLSDAVAGALAAKLPTLYALTSLDVRLRDSEAQSAGPAALDLAHAICGMSQLRAFACNVSDAAIPSLATFLRASAQLSRLELHGPDTSVDDVAVLAGALAQVATLRELSLSAITCRDAACLLKRQLHVTSLHVDKFIPTTFTAHARQLLGEAERVAAESFVAAVGKQSQLLRLELDTPLDGPFVLHGPEWLVSLDSVAPSLSKLTCLTSGSSAVVVAFDSEQLVHLLRCMPMLRVLEVPTVPAEFSAAGVDDVVAALPQHLQELSLNFGSLNRASRAALARGLHRLRALTAMDVRTSWHRIWPGPRGRLKSE
jgi:hypothetical protein